MADDTTQKLLDQARALGEAIAAHPSVQAWRQAANAVAGDADTRTLLGEYQHQAERLRQLEAQMKPVEVADKRKLAELQDQVAGNTLIKQMMAAETDYVSLMNRINQAMAGPLNAGDPGTAGDTAQEASA